MALVAASIRPGGGHSSRIFFRGKVSNKLRRVLGIAAIMPASRPAAIREASQRQPQRKLHKRQRRLVSRRQHPSQPEHGTTSRMQGLLPGGRPPKFSFPKQPKRSGERWKLWVGRRRTMIWQKALQCVSRAEVPATGD